MSDSTARRLICIPIVHKPSDVGTLGEPVRELHRRRFGQGAWQKRVANIGALWQAIPRQIENLERDARRLFEAFRNAHGGGSSAGGPMCPFPGSKRNQGVWKTCGEPLDTR